MTNILQKWWLKLGLLALLWFASCAIRFPNLNQPLGKHHEWVTAHVLITLQVWERGGGPDQFHFSPVYTYPGSGNKHIGILGGVEDEKGNFYYVSYPPFAFLLPYYLFKVSGLSFSAYNLQWFSLILHFLAGFFLFLVAHEFFKKSWRTVFFFPAWAAFALYLFIQGNLWFHSNVYFVDTLIQPLIFLQLFFFLRLLYSSSGSFRLLFIWSFCVFLSIYTEWLGLFVSFFMGIVLLFLWWRKWEFYFFKACIFLFFATLLSIGLSILQYSSIAGFDRLVEVSTEKYKLRSGHEGQEGSEYGYSISNPESFNYLEEHFNGNYLPLINLLGLAAIFLLVLLFLRRNELANQRFWIALLILFSANLLHLFMFFNFNVVHDFSTLKWAGPSIMLVVFVSWTLFEQLRKIKPLIGNAFILIFSLVLVQKFYQSKERYFKAHNPNVPAMFATNLSSAIVKYSREDEIVFTNSYITPECMHLSARNYESKPDLSTAIEHLKVSGLGDRGIYFKMEGVDVIEITRFTSSGETKLVSSQ